VSLLDPELAERVLARALANGGEFAEVFCEQRDGLAISIDESRIEHAQRGADRGAGIRVVSGETTYFAHVDGLEPDDLLATADAAAAGARSGRRAATPLAAASEPSLQAVEIDPGDVANERKAALLRELDERARSQGAEIAQVSANYSEARRRVAVANSDGAFASDERTRLRLVAQVVARRGDRAQTGFETLAGHAGFELFDDDPAAIAEQAAGKALALLDADPAPSGPTCVVVGAGFGGVLFHEMTGHGLEADGVQKGASIYAGRIGEKLAEPLLSAYDDGRLPGQWGTDAIDDEGTPTQRTAVLEEGRLASYLYDLLRARRDGVASTGNGRRESFRHLPIPRMTNTYIAPGDASPEEIIADVPKGFYAASFGGGQVEPATGDFVFGVSEGYLIENGRITRPCREATLIGNGLEVLRQIDAVGSDFDVKSGFCGKSGQRVPVGTGQGHVRVRELTVGGTAT
jgi:TldD protein